MTAGLRPRDPFTVDIARTLDALHGEWGETFCIRYSGCRWLASRTDGTGETLRGLTPDDLVVAMRADWGAPARAPVADEEFLEAAVKADWGELYDIGRADGEWYAFRLIGGQPLTARSLGELESAIRADYCRQKGAAGDAR